MKGAFQTSRGIFENPIWQDVVKFRIFFFIVGNAVFAEEGVTIHGIKLGRGQFLRSYRNLIKDLEFVENRSIKKYSLSVVSKKIDQLVKEERLKIEDTELGTLFTVVNYAEYQGFERYKKESENGERTGKEQNENGERTEKERIENNNKKDNNVKKGEKENKKPDGFSVYTSNPDLISCLESFVEFRKKIRKPLTDKAMTLLLGELDKLSSIDAEKIAILEQSILNGWQSVYALKSKQDASGSSFRGNRERKPEMPVVTSSDRPKPITQEQRERMFARAQKLKEGG